MGFEPNLQNITRYSRSFNVLTPNAFIAPFYFMAANTTGVAGQVAKYSTTQEDVVTIAGSGVKNYQIAGFLMQDVKDLDAGAVRGYRTLQNTVVNLGDNVGILQGVGNIALTKVYNGTPARLAQLGVGTNGYLETWGASNTGDPIAVVEATVSSTTPTIEPQQLSTASGPDFIRIRTYNL